jgi:hypothetical protein
MLLIFAGLVLVNWPGTQRAIVPSPVQGEG